MKCLAKLVLVIGISLTLLCITAAAVPAEPGMARTVKYSRQDIVQIRAKVRFSTLIVLPEGE